MVFTNKTRTDFLRQSQANIFLLEIIILKLLFMAIQYNVVIIIANQSMVIN